MTCSHTTDEVHCFVLTDTTEGIEVERWETGSGDLGIETPFPFSIRKTTLRGGRQAGSTLITIDTGALELTVVPTRGMGLLDARAGAIRLGWDSPVDEVIHPACINLEARGGLGWLDGFNEMLVRCGFEWSGHVGVENGRRFSLHGRVQNIPASRVVVTIGKAAPHRITVCGLVKEKTFKFCDLETWAGVSVIPGETAFHVHDELTNRSSYEREYQIIYHANFGRPILEGGARIAATAEDISPFNDVARAGLADWQTCLPPTAGFDEMVFNLTPVAGADGRAQAMLCNQAADAGVLVAYDARQLPALTVWKNTDSERQGYVVGLEPGSGYAYPRAIERAGGRIGRIGANETRTFDLEFRILNSSDAVRRAADGIAAIQAGRAIRQISEPMARE